MSIGFPVVDADGQFEGVATEVSAQNSRVLSILRSRSLAPLWGSVRRQHRIGRPLSEGPVKTEVPVILIASASSYERHRVGMALKKTGWNLCQVEDAEEAIRACSADRGVPILVIDSGLLESPRDSQWRMLRSRHPELSAVVRCLIPRGEMLRTDSHTCLVHPDDVDSTCEAIGVLSAT